MRTLLLLGLQLVLLGVWAPRSARAAYLSCQAELRNPDCSERTAPLKVPEQLLVGATCQECTGSGSDVKCAAEEKVTAASLAVETAAGAAVAGSFGPAGSCDFGVPLFKLGVGLAAGSYRLVATIAGHPKTELLAFAVVGGPPTADAGSVVAGREAGGASRTDGGAGQTGREGGAVREAGAVTGDAAAPGTDGGADGGCRCGLPVATSPGALALLLGIGLVGVRCALAHRRARR